MNGLEKRLKELKVSLEQLLSIKEQAREKLFKERGYFPKGTEGCCLLATEILAKIVKGDIRGGWFVTDSIIFEEDLEVRTEWGVCQLGAINEHDLRKTTHWWLETEKYIIDLTEKQFERFCNEEFPEVTIIPKNSKKAKRYEAEWTEENLKELL